MPDLLFTESDKKTTEDNLPLVANEESGTPCIFGDDEQQLMFGLVCFSDRNSEKSASENSPPPPPIPILQVAKLSLMFCPIWFVANYTFNWSLAVTSVSSSTVISTSSSFFALIFAHIGGVDKITIKKLGAVMLTIGGVALVSFTDKSEGIHTFWGDMLALIGAVCYGLYCSLMSVRIKDERQVSMPQFFGALS